MHSLRQDRRGLLVAALIAAALLVSAGGASALPSFFSSNCALSGCHTNDTPTCNGCHHHRGSLTATKDQAQYYPGQTVTVTLNGGTQSGWIRGILYDAQNVEIARRTGPTGTGDDSQGSPVVFPVQLQAPAPGAPGNYTWKAAWFGNWNDGGSVHQEQRVNVTITVVQDPGDVADGDSPTFLNKTWGRIKEKFAR
jgi:hypothetical protein